MPLPRWLTASTISLLCGGRQSLSYSHGSKSTSKQTASASRLSQERRNLPDCARRPGMQNSLHNSVRIHKAIHLMRVFRILNSQPFQDSYLG